MKVYAYRGKNPQAEIEHIKTLLGTLYQDHNSYDEDGSIVLKVVEPLESNWKAIHAILSGDGYECEKW